MQLFSHVLIRQSSLRRMRAIKDRGQAFLRCLFAGMQTEICVDNGNVTLEKVGEECCAEQATVVIPVISAFGKRSPYLF